MIEQAEDLAQRGGDPAAESALYLRLGKRSVGTLGLMVAGTGLSLLAVLFLARLLGARGYGAYTYAKTWISVLGVVAVLGLEGLIIRSFASHGARSEWALMGGLLRRAQQLALAASLGLALLAVVGSLILAPVLDPLMVRVFWVSLLLLPLAALARIRNAALQGLHYVVMAQVPQMLLHPILFIMLIWGAFLVSDRTLSAPWAMGMNVVAGAVTVVTVGRLLHRVLPPAIERGARAYRTPEWVRSALPLLLINGIFIINSATDTLMLGALKGAESVGTYAVARRAAGLVTFVMMAVNAALSPTISALFASGELAQLQRLVTRSIRVTFLVSLPVAATLLGLGDWFLQIFGQEFIRGETALAILSTGQVITIALGSVSVLLIMTGHERDAAIGVAAGAALNIALNALLIPRWDLDGAAAATAASLVAFNCFLAVRVHARLGIHSTAVGSLSRRRHQGNQ